MKVRCARRGRLRWEDLDLEEGALQVVRTLQRVGGELRAVTPKTRSSRRTVPLVGLLAERAETLTEPYTRHLDGKVRELRFHLSVSRPA